MNATPEDILGVPTHRVVFEAENVKVPEPAATPVAEVQKTPSGPQPMDEYEERARRWRTRFCAPPRISRGVRRGAREIHEEGSGAAELEGEELAPVHEDNVRFSEDLTISSRSRKRRKLFGR